MFRMTFIALGLTALAACEISEEAPEADVVFTGAAVYRVQLPLRLPASE